MLSFVLFLTVKNVHKTQDQGRIVGSIIEVVKVTHYAAMVTTINYNRNIKNDLFTYFFFLLAEVKPMSNSDLQIIQT